MKQRILTIFLAVSWSVMSVAPVQAHTIGGAYASQVSCTWGQLGYQYGWIGVYNVNGQMVSQFFGDSYCPF